MAVKVILDTNFLTIPAEFSVDIFAEAERVLEQRVDFILLDSVLEEIEQRAANPRNRTEGFHFAIALKLVSRCTVVTIASGLSEKAVDDQLLEYTKNMNGVLATNDRELRQRSRLEGVPVLFLRGKKKLDVEGSVM